MGEERGATQIDVRLGQRVRTRRVEIGMSQERLADILGITFQQVQKYEKGVNRIAASRLWDISKALELPIAKLFDGLGGHGAKGRSPPDAFDLMSTEEGQELAGLFSRLKSKVLRRRVVDLVRALIEQEV